MRYTYKVRELTQDEQDKKDNVVNLKEAEKQIHQYFNERTN